MKNWMCTHCYAPIRVFKEYEEEYCCNGFECGCYGYPSNPVFCDECEKQIYGEVLRR